MKKFEIFQTFSTLMARIVGAWVAERCSCASLRPCTFAEDEAICYYERASVERDKNFKPPLQKHINFLCSSIYTKT